jgi:hypothetical protein
MILQPLLTVVLHCSRCNEALKDDDDRLILWNETELRGLFPASMQTRADVFGWMRVGDRVLCPDCWTTGEDEEPVEMPPLPAGEAHNVALFQSAYAPYEHVRAAYAKASREAVKGRVVCRDGLVEAVDGHIVFLPSSGRPRFIEDPRGLAAALAAVADRAETDGDDWVRVTRRAGAV